MYFVNGLCPWDKNYFVRLKNFKPEELTEFTKTQILNIESRNDEDIFALYNLAHNQYQEHGGIDLDNWINLYDSFLNIKTDENFDKRHPGVQSNMIYFELIKNRLSELGII